jgi:octaheme c-type cytochrome (tetrathionate reductase family)
MRDFKFIWVVGLIATALIVIVPVVLAVRPDSTDTVDPWAGVPEDKPATDHSALMRGPYETGREVTLTCLSCHEDAAAEVMRTNHWTWQAPPVEVDWRDEPVSTGKANVINNFCIGIQSNWTGCTRCHAGYGWDSASFFETAGEDQVDCLVCHDQSGQYAKAAAGEPAEGVDLALAAQSVGRPTRTNCGYCHFNGGGGDAVKHGDLDETLYFPDEQLDVHMGRHDFQCIDCHQTANHDIAGRAISVSVDNANQIACTDCHDGTQHDDARINAHTDTVACQTCHIPAAARREPTKMVWDWSTAGQDLPENEHEYLKIKGSFIYEGNIIPSYDWYAGTAERYLLGDSINPDEVTKINDPIGSIADPASKIWPFKVHTAKQIYDSVNNYLLVPKTVGEGGYWTEFDWDLALQLGSEQTGLDYSGEYGFTETEMYWPITHMVAPSEQVLQCTDCHSANGRLDWGALGYLGDPMRWGGRITAPTDAE